MKTIFALVATFLIILSFPQNAFAEYYNRKGEVIQPTPPVLPKVVQNKPPKLPYGIGISTKDRKNSTSSYTYIIENECKTLAVNLYDDKLVVSISKKQMVMPND